MCRSRAVIVFRGSDVVEWIIRLVQQTGMVMGIMVCVTGVTLGAVKLAERMKRFQDRKKGEGKK